MRCRHCNRDYDPSRKTQGGYIWQCDECSTEIVDRFVGRMGEKCEWMEVFKTNIKYWKGHLKRESARGFSPNVPVSSPQFESMKEDKGQE